MKELTLPAAVENLYNVLDFIADALAQHHCPARVSHQVVMAAEEIFVNVARYAYAPTIGLATVRCVVGGDPLSVILEFLDNGMPFNPLSKEDPDTALPLAERPVGGLGIYLVKHSMDSVEYAREGGKNILTIKKRLGPQERGEA